MALDKTVTKISRLDAIIDLSHWQNSVDFRAVKVGGVEAVILKATQGISWVDPRFIERVHLAQAAGLLVGAYHFCDASPSAIQVSHFMSVANSLRVLAIDIEANDLPGDTVSIAQAAEIAARLQAAHGRAPLIYIGRYGPDGTGKGLPNSVLMRCPLWLPQYNSATPTEPAGWGSCLFWQHTNNGPTLGVGHCDRTSFAGDLASLHRWW